ncbi:MAG: molybdopterin-guanine dinucleotide biosynthesis protein B [Caldisericaceae bacterium]|nr:molybdopterin-guanine dinucleotide biosynthesis protein B [Caldisericaceae bacterium]
MKILQIVGPKNSGKTVHAEWRISELRNRGLKIGALKHSGHHHPIDRPGSDSFRLQKAGANPTVFWSVDGLAVFYTNIVAEKTDQLLQTIFDGCDLVIIESFSQLQRPKLVIDPDSKQMKNFSNVIAVICEKNLNVYCPVFKKLDSDLVEFLLNYFDLPKSKSPEA